MFRSLRSRLIISHVLPFLIVLPLLNLALIYTIESQFLTPQLAGDLQEQARLAAQLVRIQGNDQDALSQALQAFQQISPGVQAQIIYLTPDGDLLYTNDPAYPDSLPTAFQTAALLRASNGEEVLLTDYSFWVQPDGMIQVYAPARDLERQVTGIVWMSYYTNSLHEIFQRLRVLNFFIILLFLGAGSLIGLGLSLNISKPIQKVTQAIDTIIEQPASAPRQSKIDEKGPQEVRELVRAVNLLAARLDALEAARRHLLANLVHELGRPLGALRSAIQALARGADQDPQLLLDLTQGMDEETARLQHLLDEVALMHDQALGTLELNRQPLAISEWLGHALIPWQQAANDKHLHWQTNIPDALPVVNVDEFRLAQIIGNLLSNAIKYTPPGKSVSVSAGVPTQDIAEHAAGQLWIRISDTGPGIAPEERQKILLPFYRGSQGRRIKQGMGLGLSIANDLVLAHGGLLEIDSAPGAGSRFTVWIP
jgi:signal transduction histidine kinase